MRRYHSLLLICLLATATLSSTTGTLMGVVINRATGDPITGAIVRLVQKSLIDTTDEKGTFLFNAIPMPVISKAGISNEITQPRYIPGRGIVLTIKEPCIVTVAIFNINGRLVTHLNNSMLKQGVWTLPLNTCANGLYLCRILVKNKLKTFRFMKNETGCSHNMATKMINYGGTNNRSSLKKALSGTITDSVITTKPGFNSDTTVWSGKIIDSLTILLDSGIGGNISGASVRQIIPFDDDWRFYKGNASGAEKTGFTDESWRILDVPHDWSIEGPFDKNAQTAGYGGYLPAGIGWYRKHFTLPADLSGQHVFIEFDGVMANSTVYCNGISLGTRPFGYISFRYEITDNVHFGTEENVVAVNVDNSAQPASRWYTGAGIYGHVRLIATNPVHIGQWTTCITTPTVTSAQATVHLQTEVINQGKKGQTVTVKTTIIDPDGSSVGSVTSDAQTVSAGKSADFEFDITVAKPQLWDITSPVMYQAVTTILSGDATLDDETVSFGIRTIEYDPANGFLLNKKSVKHKGVCLHHDLSGLGAAMHQRAMQRRLATLKKLGVNAIRTAHNPVVPQVLDLCDRMGFLVMDEFFDVWKSHKYNMPGDYATYFNKWYKIDAADIVKRDRNHPSVVLYSIGNEIRDGLSTRTPIATDLVNICHTNDPTRPVTQALFRPSQSGDYPGATLNILDVFGVNYRTTELLEAITGSNHTGVMTEIGAKPSNWTNFVMKNTGIIGKYIWTGADYLGESNDRWPNVGAGCGLIDRVGTVRDIGYQYQKIWSTNNDDVRPKTSSGTPVTVLLSVDHPIITTDCDDVAYVIASIVDAAGVVVGNANNSVTFTVSGSSGKIIAVDSGTQNGESFRGNTRKAYNGICFAIVRMTAPGSITVDASATGLTGSSVTVTGVHGIFVPCSGTCD